MINTKSKLNIITKYARTLSGRLGPVTSRTIILALLALVVCVGANTFAIRNHVSSDGPTGCAGAGLSCQQPIAAPAPTTSPLPSALPVTSLPPASRAAAPKASGPTPISAAPTNDALAKYEQCNSANNAAEQKYSAATKQAQAAYDAVMAQWNAVKNQPAATHNPYTEYAAQAKLNYNAISIPAYGEYVTTLNSLKAQGCQIVQLYQDSSWK